MAMNGAWALRSISSAALCVCVFAKASWRCTVQRHCSKAALMLSADEVLHLYIQERPGQTRGVTWFASAIKRLHHLAGYEEAEVIRARASQPDGLYHHN